MIYKGIIFDLDGTLIDSIEDLADCMNRVLTENGYLTHDLTAYKVFVGNGINRLVRRALPEGVDETQVMDCFNRMMLLYSDNCIIKTRSYPAIFEMLVALLQQGVSLAVLSNKADELTRKIVSDLFPGFPFLVVQGMTSEASRKPNPHTALQICRQMGLEPHEVAFVGDTAIDMQTAQNAGMTPVGVLWGFRSRDELLDNGARYIINHPMELLTV